MEYNVQPISDIREALYLGRPGIHLHDQEGSA